MDCFEKEAFLDGFPEVTGLPAYDWRVESTTNRSLYKL